MLRVGVGHSPDSNTARAVAEAAGQAMRHAGVSQPDLALIFFTVNHLKSQRPIPEILKSATGTERIVGCSASGILTGEGEIEGSSAVAIMVLSSDRIEGQPLFFQPLRGRDREAGEELARTVQRSSTGNPLLVLFPDAYHCEPSRIFQGVQREAGFVPIVGAGCSEGGTPGKTVQLCGDQMASNALSGLLLAGPLEISIGITQGCQPVSAPLVISKAEGNLIYEIEERPACEAFAEVLKGPFLEDLRRALAYVFVGLPADRERNDVGGGQYVVRNIVGLDPRAGVLAIADQVSEGERMIFVLRDAQRAREDLGQMLARQAQKLRGRPPQFGLYFNCCARGSALYQIPGIDTAYIRQSLGDFPLIGFFGNFEMGPLADANRLLTYTGVLVLVREALDG